jgi:ribose 1,5-bisphosphokinase PhnN
VSLVILVGRSGVGKTCISDYLGPLLMMEAVGPDDHRDRWEHVYKITDQGPCIVECCKIPRALRRIMRYRPWFVVELTAPDAVLRERLHRAGLDAGAIAGRLSESGIHYANQTPLRPSLRLVSEGDPKDLARIIARAAREAPETISSLIR